MRIQCVTTLPPHPGGSAVSNALLTAGFAAAGHSVSVLAPITPEALRAGDAFAARHPDLRITRFEVPYFEVAPNLPATGQFREIEREQIHALLPALITRERPDVIFVGRETFAWHVPSVAKDHGIPSVLRLAGSATLGALNRTLSASEAQGLLEHFRQADQLVLPARHLAASVQALGIADVTVIRNPVDLRRFAPQAKDRELLSALRLAEDHLIVAHASNLKSMKRPMDVIDAAAALRHNSRLRYLIIGDGPCRQAMEAACKARGLSDAFRFVGWIEYADMPRYINLADIVVHPSDAEAQARACLESQACGRFVLASDIPGAREVISDGETGRLFRMGDCDDLVTKLADAAADPEGRSAIGQRARLRVQAHALPTIVHAYLELLARVVRRARRNGGS